MGSPFSPFSRYRVSGMIEPRERQYDEEETTLVPGPEEGFRGAGATVDLGQPEPGSVVNPANPYSAALPYLRRIPRLLMSLSGPVPFPDSSEIPEGLPAGRPGPVNALPAAMNSFEEQVRAGMFGGGQDPGSTPLIPMRTPGSPTASMPAPTSGGRMRAIRMPNGTFLYTNRDELGGEEFSTKDAGTIGRAQAGEIGVADLQGRPARIDPTSATAQALIQRAVEAETRGKQVPGVQPDTSGGAASFIEGTPEQRRELDLEKALGLLALSEIQQDTELAQMSPEQRAMVSNPDLVAGAFVDKQLKREMGQANQEAELAAREISTPGHPKFISDEAARRKALLDIQERRDQQIQGVLARGSLMMGRSIPRSY